MVGGKVCQALLDFNFGSRKIFIQYFNKNCFKAEHYLTIHLDA